MLASASMGPAFSLASTLGVMVVAAGAMTGWALLATTAIMILIALTFVQLTARFPNAGSSYAWARRAFGEGVGAYTAWVLIVANFFAVLATAIPAGVYTLELIAPPLADNALWDAAVGCVWIVACTLVLYAGMRPTARVAAGLLCAELAVLAASVVASMTLGAPAPVAAAPSPAFGGFVTAMVLAIWMVDGWEVSASTSEETRGSPVTAGAGGLAGLLVTALFLIACTLAYMRLAGPGAIAGHEVDVLAFVGDRLGGTWKTVLIATVLVSLAAALETTLLYLVRSLYAMGRDGVVPAALGRLGTQTHDPDLALAVVAAASLAGMLLIGFVPTANQALEIALSGTSVFLGLLFLISCAAALKLRDKESPLCAILAVPLLVAILGIAVAQAPPPTRWCVFAGLGLGIPIALRAWRKVAAPEALNTRG